MMIFFRVGIDLPKIEIRYENLSVEGDVHVGSRALPTLINATMNSFEVFFFTLSFLTSQILYSVCMFSISVHFLFFKDHC